MEADQHGRQPKFKTTTMKDNQKWKTTKVEDDRRHMLRKYCTVQ